MARDRRKAQRQPGHDRPAPLAEADIPIIPGSSDVPLITNAAEPQSRRVETPAEARERPDAEREAPAREAPRAAADEKRNAGREIARAVRRQWRFVLLAAMAGALLAWIAAAAQPKRYRASAVAAVTPLVREMPVADILRGVDSLDRRVLVSTVAALASTPATRAEAGAAPEEWIGATVLPMTTLFTITVEGNDPKHAAAVANAVPSALGRQARAMFVMYGVALASPATPPPQAVFPRVERAVLAGLFAGLAAGIAAAWWVERRRATAG